MVTLADLTRVVVVTLGQAVVGLVVEGILADQAFDQVAEVNQVVLGEVEDLVGSCDPVEAEALVEEEAQVDQAVVVV